MMRTFEPSGFIFAANPPIHTCPSSLFFPAMVEGFTTCCPFA